MDRERDILRASVWATRSVGTHNTRASTIQLNLEWPYYARATNNKFGYIMHMPPRLCYIVIRVMQLANIRPCTASKVHAC